MKDMKRLLVGSLAQRGIRRFLLILVFGFGLLAIGVLVLNVRQQLRELETASSDNVQFYLSQIQVEHLIFLAEAYQTSQNPDDELTELKKRFDIFYSRVKTLEKSRLYTDLNKFADIEENLVALNVYLDATAVAIDSDPQVLRENLPLIISDGRAALDNSRKFALDGISFYSAKRDKQREAIHDSFVAISILSAILFLVLIIALYLLSWLNAVNRNRSIQIHEANCRLSAIITTSLDAIVAADRDGRIREFNNSAESIFGYTRDEVIGERLGDLIVPEHFRQAHQEGMQRYRDTGKLVVSGAGRVRLEAMRKSGEVFPVEMNIERSQSPSGDIFVSFLRDITQQVADEEELKEARDAAIAGEKSKSDFLAVMSHEMRTPLNGLLGTLQLLENTELNEKQQRYMQIMNKSGSQLLTHVNDVLDITRLEAGRFEFSESVFDLNASMRELLDSLHGSAEDAGNQLEFNSDQDDENLVFTDELRLQQVMLNLVGNAIKFTRNGTIIVETENLDKNGMVEIRVIDTGIGIAADRLDNIFEDFQTLDSSFGRMAGGTGLGLGIARRVTEGMGGTIGVESEEGEGTLFWVRLPIRTVETSGRSSEKIARQNTNSVNIKPLHILIVEDNEINREIAREFLEKDNHQVTEAHNGRQGVDTASSNAFDLILMDISMPELDGVEATRIIRRHDRPNKSTPIIALTAHVQASDEERFRAAGMTDVIHKPLNRQALTSAIQKQGGIVSKPQQAASNYLLNPDVVEELQVELGDQKYRDLFAKFIAKVDSELASLQAQSQTINADELADKLHSVAGPVAMFGATAMYAHVQKFEQAIRAGETVDAHHVITSSRELWQSTKHAFDKKSVER